MSNNEIRQTILRPIRTGVEPGHVDHDDGLTVRMRTCTAKRRCKANLDLHLVEWREGMPDAVEYAGRYLLDLAAKLRKRASLKSTPTLSPIWRFVGRCR